MCLACAGAAFVALCFLAPKYLDLRLNTYGVVLAPGEIVRSAPGPEEPEYFEAVEGERLKVTETDTRGWYRVKRPADGLVGYLPEDIIGLL